MKYFKYLLSLSIICLFIVSCNSPERSVGMTNWTDDGTEFKFYIGTEEAIKTVMEWDKLQNESKWKDDIELFADTATFTYQTWTNSKSFRNDGKWLKKEIQTRKLRT